jgi:hypothetical protein
MTKEELTELVNKVSDEVSGVYTDVSNTGNVNMDAVNMLARNMVQIQRNCMNILVETLYRLMEMGKM